MFAALTVAAGMHATIPAFAQNINDLLTIFGGDRQRAARHAQTEWRRLPPAEMACIDQRLRRKGSSVEALIRRGVKPSAARLIELRSSCGIEGTVRLSRQDGFLEYQFQGTSGPAGPCPSAPWKLPQRVLLRAGSKPQQS